VDDDLADHVEHVPGGGEPGIEVHRSMGEGPAAGELVGGMWTGHPADGPDDVLIASGGPALKGEMLSEADHIPWSFVRELAEESVKDGAMPTIDLRK